MFRKSLTVLVTGDTIVGWAGVLASNRFALCNTVTVAVSAEDVHPRLSVMLRLRDTGAVRGFTKRIVASLPSSLICEETMPFRLEEL